MNGNPPTLAQAEKRKLLVDMKHGIYTFSNGTHWDFWADRNCYECWHWDEDCAGARCAFEGASLLSMVSPELAQMFGWTQDPQYDEPTDHRDGWTEPRQCAFFRDKHRDDGGENPPPPPTDPRQLVLIADPTEDAAVIVNAPEPQEVCA